MLITIQAAAQHIRSVPTAAFFKNPFTRASAVTLSVVTELCLVHACIVGPAHGALKVLALESSLRFL